MFNYFMPVKFITGKNCVLESNTEFKTYGTKAFIVTGKNSAVVSGAQKDVIEKLNKEKIEFIIYNEIRENPTTTTIQKGADLFLENNCNFLIGIGGGSAIDSAKAISVITANNIKVKDVYNPQNLQKAFPLISIPTTSGTGTEVTPFSVITDPELNKKAGFGNPLIFPKVSFLDPKYMRSMSVKVTRDTAIDALSHLLEGLYSNKRNEIIFPMIFEGISVIIKNLKKTMENPDDLELREKLMIASTWGGMVIAQTGTTVQHSIGYPVTSTFGTTHGMANGIFMKSVLEMFYPSLKTIIDRLFTYLNMTREEFYVWLESVGVKADFKLTDEFIDKKSIEVSESRNMALNPIKVDIDKIKELYSQFK